MAPGKRQNRKRKDWPSGLQAQTRPDGRVYYSYRRPDLPRGADFEPIGYVSEAEAKEIARELNNAFAPGGKLAQAIIAKTLNEGSDTIGDWCDKMVKDILPKRRYKGHPMSPRTLLEYKRYYGNIKKSNLGKMPILLAEQSDNADFLKEIGTTGEVFNKYRERLIDLYTEARSDGVKVENWPARIKAKDKGPKVRKRITLPGERPGEFGIDGIEAYKAIFAKADHAIRCAMELSLNALQRRQEIFKWRTNWSREDHDGRHVYIKISKTKKHGPDSYVRIPESLPVVHSEFGATTLGEIIEKCFTEEPLRVIGCPFLVHQRPKRVKKAKGREHPFQLRDQTVSKGFARALRATGLYDHLKDGEHPTLHEVIALGEHLRETLQGWTKHDLRVLRGHTQERTESLYLDGHAWTTVTFPGQKKA